MLKVQHRSTKSAQKKPVKTPSHSIKPTKIQVHRKMSQKKQIAERFDGFKDSIFTKMTALGMLIILLLFILILSSLYFHHPGIFIIFKIEKINFSPHH
jgi:hypothetical protein